MIKKRKWGGMGRSDPVGVRLGGVWMSEGGNGGEKEVSRTTAGGGTSEN